MAISKLNNLKINAAKPQDKIYKLYDGDGLCLWIRPSGRKSWIFNYTRPSDGKRTSLTLGEYPDISLAKAREICKEKRARLKQGNDLFTPLEKITTLNEVFPDWLQRWRQSVSDGYAKQMEQTLKANIFSLIGDRDISKITPRDIVETLTPMEARGSLVQLRRTKQALSLVFDFAINRGICNNNPAYSVKNNAFLAPKTKHLAALKPEELPYFLDVIQKSDIQIITKCCILFQLLTLCRPAEATNAEWAEINLTDRLWTIPAERMKAKREHAVPLSKMTIEVLSKMKAISGQRKYVFTGRDFQTAMNRETPRIALRRLRIKNIETTAHGLRALGRTYLERSGMWRTETMEAALAHSQKNKIIAAYNRFDYLEERTKMLEWWGDEIKNHIEI